MKQILLVEDDPNISKGVMFNLEQEKFHGHWSKSLSEARGFLQNHTPDLILLDVGLPDGNGIEFCREFRKQSQSTPVILLTARVDENSVVAGFEAGASDYVKKPFSNKELMARVKANTNHYSTQLNIVEFYGLKIDLDRREAHYQEHNLELNRRQLDILFYFTVNNKRVVTRESILGYLGSQGNVIDRTIDAHISQIRRKFKNLGITSIQLKPVYGIGYRLENAD